MKRRNEMDREDWKLAKVFLMAASLPVLILWLVLCLEEGFLNGTLILLISNCIILLIVAWFKFVIYLMDKEEENERI